MDDRVRHRLPVLERVVGVEQRAREDRHAREGGQREQRAAQPVRADRQEDRGTEDEADRHAARLGEEGEAE